MKNLFAIIISLILCVSVTAQDEPKAILFTEFSTKGTCEIALRDLDQFYNELNTNPAASGVIVIYSARENHTGDLSREAQIQSWIGIRNFDKSRTQIIRGEFRENAKTEFWIVPPGADLPAFTGETWSYDLSHLTKPWVIGTEYADGIGGCQGYDFGNFIDFLKENPNMRGHIVIGESSRAKFRRAENEFRKTLAENKIPKRRVRAFFVKVEPNRLAEYRELWLVPNRK